MGLISSIFKSLFGGVGGFGRVTVSADTQSRIKSDWRNIQTLINGGQPSQLRQALITADKSLDNALRDVVAGDSMGERLKNAKDKFDWAVYDKIWKAHKIRNSLVHESGYEPTHTMVTNAIDDLKKGLNRLGVSV